MIKRLLVGGLATLGAAVLVLLLVVAAAGWLFWPQPQPLPERIVLQLDLRAAFEDTPPPAPLAVLGLEPELSLPDAVLALEAAADDPTVAGLVASLSGEGPTLAQSQELRAAIARFRSRGKFALAHADSFGEFGPGTLGYYLASGFDEIHLQPLGAVGLTGIMLQVPLLRGLFDQIGVLPSGGQRGPYKTAAETFTRSDLTPEHRESLNWLADSIDQQIRTGLAEGRGLAPEAIGRLIDGGPYVSAEARANGLIDAESYWDQVQDQAKARAPGAELVELQRYARSQPAPADDAPVIALIDGIGEIQSGESSAGATGWVMGGDTVAKALRDAVADPEVKAILFRINSGGGSAVASETIGRQVRLAAARDKPVIVSMGDVAASGGYWIAMDAAKIVADPGTLTGSIGVFAGKPVLAELWQKLGVNWGEVARGANAGIWSLNSDYSNLGRARLEAFLDATYQAFTAGVARGRKLPPEQVEQLAEGRVWTGAQAKELGLVDELGGFSQALIMTKTMAGLAADQPVQLRSFPPPRSPLEELRDLVAEGPIGVRAWLGWLAASRAAAPQPGSLSLPPIQIR